MTRLLMVVLTIGAIGCGVDADPQSSAAPADDSADTSTSTGELGQVSPSLSSCRTDSGGGSGSCLSRETCVANGGISSVVPCNLIGWTCCNPN